MSEQVEKTPTEVLEDAIRSMGLSAEQVLVGKDGCTVQGFSVVITDPATLIELMRRTRELSAEFVPNPVTDEQFVIFLRED